MTLLFNADFEQQIQSEKPKVESSLINQELEYFLFFLENEKVYTTKKYSNHYIEHVQSLNANVLTTSSKDDLKMWWGDYDNIELSRKLNSKLVSTRFALANNLCPDSTKIINSINQVEDGFIYKDPSGHSGRGIFKCFERDKIQKLLQQTPMVASKLVNRIYDISFLKSEDDELIYQNIVDEHFQYKGTIIADLEISTELLSEFINATSLVKKFMQENNAKTPWSMDGFIYHEGNLQKLYCLSEINYRKTMGYITWNLHKKWNSTGVSQLLLIPFSKVKVQEKFIKEKNLIQLSPWNNRFISFFLKADSRDELGEVYKYLICDYCEFF